MFKRFNKSLGNTGNGENTNHDDEGKNSEKYVFLNVNTVFAGKVNSIDNLNTLSTCLSPSEVATPNTGDTIVRIC